MRKAFSRCIASIAAICLASAAFADIPRLITYQGKVLTGGGGVVAGPVNATFAFYPMSSGGVALFTESHIGIPVSGSVFTVNIGSNTIGGIPDTALNSSEIWLGISINGGPEMTPRQRLVMVPYAAKSNASERLVRPDTFTTAAQVDPNGNIGIAGGRFDFASGVSPLITAGHNNQVGFEKRMWIAHSTDFPNFGIQYRDLSSDGLTGDNIEFVLGNQASPIIRIGNQGLASQSGGADTSRLEPSGIFSTTNAIYVRMGLSTTIQAEMSKTAAGGRFRSLDENGIFTTEIGSAASGGLLNINQSSGLVGIAAVGQGSGGGGEARVYNSLQNDTILIDGDNGDNSYITMRNSQGSQRLGLWGGEATIDAGRIIGFNAGTVAFDLKGAESSTLGSNLQMYQTNGTRTVQIEAEDGPNGGSQLSLYNGTGSVKITLDGNGFGSAGDLNMWDSDGNETVTLRAAANSTQGADMTLRNASGLTTITLDADSGVSSIGRITTGELNLTGGADLSEYFNVNSATLEVEPGMVVCIDPDKQGDLRIATKAYDSTVAGVISGAGGINSGITMSQKDSLTDGRHPVALTGRVYAMCDAGYGAIKPGDLLTTSKTAGHAMKVEKAKASQAQGAIIGKAMTSLSSGKGLVLVLVSLH